MRGLLSRAADQNKKNRLVLFFASLPLNYSLDDPQGIYMQGVILWWASRLSSERKQFPRPQDILFTINRAGQVYQQNVVNRPVSNGGSVMAVIHVSCSFLLIIFFCGNEISAKEIYTNLWAVKVRGSQQEAVELAVKYGFSYDEHVSVSFALKQNEQNLSLSLKMRFNAFECLLNRLSSSSLPWTILVQSLKTSTLSYLVVYYRNWDRNESVW